MKLGLGRFLVKCFSRPKASGTASLGRNFDQKRRKSKSKIQRLSLAAAVSRTPRPPHVREAKVAIQPMPALIQSIAQVQVQVQATLPVATQQDSHDLFSASLISPDEKLRQAIEAFLLNQRSQHTQRAYGKDIKRFIKFLHLRRHQKGIESINRSVIIAYKEHLLGEGLEHTTVDRHISTLRSFFGWLVDEGFLQKNPAEAVRFLNPKRLSRTNAFTDDEVCKILDMPDIHTKTGALHRAILTLLFYCGLRRSELCLLKTSNLGSERGHNVIKLCGKGDAERIVVLVPVAWKALQYYFKISRKDQFKDQYIFTPLRNNRTGLFEKPIDPSAIFYIVTRYARMAGVAKRVSPHSCRATAISNARDHNAPDRAIQEFAGWATPDMITRYDKRKSSVEKSAAHSISYSDVDGKAQG